ncbi:general odorant-binding protein 71 [Halyomorpha halys]|uniref:general odorant-binding protein 71 n=1 Tax=Halyomorpha halys TaxID=286706 RepID=UPI0006D4CD61|nr:general odorant-binding protein 71 [Halyomorpha halys]KAE8573791.1 Odorant-binding protein 5 [Halyomorpha halys]
MSYVVYLLLLSTFFSAQGLRCRMEQDEESQDEFEDIVRNCLREETLSTHHKENQDNRNKGYTRNNQQEKFNSSGGKRGKEDNYGKDEEEYDYNEYDNDNSNNRDKNTQRRTYSQSTQKPQGSQYQGSKQTGARRNQGSRNIGSPLESIEPCIIHCIFKQKKMLNQNNKIDKSNTMHILTQKIRDSELKEFVEDSINECFDKMDNEKSEGKCEDSKKFALCLEEKGKNNCEDWDTNSNHTADNTNTFSNFNYNGPDESQSKRGERGNNRHQYETNNNSKDKMSGCFVRNERDEREGSKMKHESSNDKSSNNRKSSDSDHNEQKIKFSDYFQTRG